MPTYAEIVREPDRKLYSHSRESFHRNVFTGNHHSRDIPEEVRVREMLKEARQAEGHCIEQREFLYVNNVK